MTVEIYSAGDEMAVYTKLTENDIDEIGDMYNLGKILDYKGIEKGIMNSNYLLETQNSKYIFRILEGNRDINNEIDELKYLEHLSKNGIPCPNVLRTKLNMDYIIIKGKMGVLFSFLEGSEVEVVNKKLLNEFGEILGKMHNLSVGKIIHRNEKIEMDYLYEILIKDEKKLKNLLNSDYNIINKKYNDIKQKIENIYDKLPKGVNHNDIFPDNVFVKDGKISGVIDFNDALSDVFLNDISIVINFWIYNKLKKYDLEYINSFLEGYQKERKLTKLEKISLPIFLEKTALTFVFLRIRKFNFHDVEGEREFKDYRDLLPMVFENKNIIKIN
ncbi:homoserine kinase [Haliovirga abyssi]|uniref:Homoserine kinase n=1 Tax=Haliovirga abyssi TaxID=2996794 RepID=A0AAU9DZB6_9FUSO|nr:homoserine kinase [Haliovirga abyssi]BDU50870.1 homoserine kinase [Haliovirga abyssi]